MKTITVLTPANIEIEFRLAGAGSRLAAFVIDFLLQMLISLILGGIVLFGISGYRFSTLSDAGGYALALLIIAYFVIYFGYFVFCELTMNGQSVGKKIFGLRVIKDNGQPVGLAQSLVRNLFRVALDMLYIGLFIILFSKKHKRFGDMAAGTVVVSEHYSLSGDAALTLPEPPQGSRISARYSHITLTDDEKYILHGYMRQKETLPDGGKDLRNRLITYLAQKWQIEPSLFDDGVLSQIAKLHDFV